MQDVDAPKYDFHLPPALDGFECIASAADEAMADVLISDWMTDRDRADVTEINQRCAA